MFIHVQFHHQVLYLPMTRVKKLDFVYKLLCLVKNPGRQLTFTWWFQICLIVTPIWGRFPIWLYHIFSDELKPPTKYDRYEWINHSFIFGFFQTASIAKNLGISRPFSTKLKEVFGNCGRSRNKRFWPPINFHLPHPPKKEKNKKRGNKNKIPCLLSS